MIGAVTSAVRVRVLGPVEVEVDGRPVPLTPALRALVAALAVSPGRIVAADALVARIWDAEVAPVTLQSYVSRLRRRLAGPGTPVPQPPLLTRAPGYRWDLDATSLDAAAFGAALERARAEDDTARARATVGAALAAWRGTPYADVPQAFARAEAARLEALRLQTRQLAAELDLALGRHQEVVEELQALLADQPLDEGLRALTMLALYRCDRAGQALEVYEQGRRALAESLGADPGPALRRLHEQVLRHDRALHLGADVPVAAPDPGTTTRRPVAALPVPTTPLVGREDDLAEVVDRLRAGTRLLTLTGTGGVGKTRLATAAARAASPDFPGGVHLVPLATVGDPGLVLPTVARALGLARHDTATALGEVADHLAGRRALLVLDNLEHLLEAGPDVARLVAACPDLAVLVTSRAPLRVGGEQERLVEPLSVRSDGTGPAGSPAARLFVERARAVTHRFATDGSDDEAVAEICARLAGIPLALELAASRLRVLDPQSLLLRLDEALGAGARDLPDRQRTMRATLDWSHRLLDPDAAKLYRRLAVFHGGWTLPLLHEVEGPDALAALETLVEHSLVAVTWGEHEPRYRLLEPVRQHARTLLGDDERVATGRRHAAAYLDLAERAACGYRGSEQVRWLGIVDREHANLHAALELSLAEGDAEVAARTVWALWLYWWFRHHSVVGRRLAAAATGLAGLSSSSRTRAHVALAAMAFAQDDRDAAATAWSTALEAATADGDVEAAAHAEAGLGIVALASGDLAGATARHRRAIALAGGLDEASDGPWIVAINHVWLGTALLEQGRVDEALEAFDRGLALARRSGDRLASFVALWNLARAWQGRDDDTAHRHLVAGTTLAQEVGDRANLSYFLDAMVAIEGRRERLGDPGRLAALLGAAAAQRDRAGTDGYSYYLPDVESRDRAADRVRTLLGEDAYADAVRRGGALDVDAAVALALRG